MGRTKIKSGDILKIPLWKSMGYCYAKYIDLEKHHSKCSYPSLIKVYDLRKENQEIDVNSLLQRKYLIQPIFVAGILPTLKSKKWEVIGNLPFVEDDEKISHFKIFRDNVSDIKDAKYWYVIKDLVLSNRIFVNYEDVKHLELYSAQGTGNIEIRLTMYFMMQDGLAISDYFDLEDEKFGYLYRTVNEIPLLSDLPEELRGKAFR